MKKVVMDYGKVIDAFCDSKGFSRPERERRFAPPRRFRFDFFWENKSAIKSKYGTPVALEIEGGVYTGGRHTSIKGYESDCVKYSLAAMMGIVVLRVTTGMLKKGVCWPWLEKVLI